MSDKRNVILVKVDYSRAVVLPFTPKGVKIAEMLRAAPMHDCSVYMTPEEACFVPSDGEPIEVSVAMLEMDAAPSIARLKGEISSKESEIYAIRESSRVAERDHAEGKAWLGSKIAGIRKSVSDAAGGGPVDAGVKRGQGAAVKAAKLAAGLKEANSRIEAMRAAAAAE